MVEEKVQKKLLLDMRNLLKTSSGRAVLYYFILQGVPAEAIYCPERPQDTAFNCGKATVAQAIKSLVLAADKAAFLQMVNEWNSMITSLEKEQSENQNYG